jgi:hypothetical protein
MPRSLRLVAIVVLAALTQGGRLEAQAPSGSRYLALDHWAYEYIARLRERGYLGDLNPLAQPYRRLDVARGLAGLDPDTLGRPVAEWVRLLKQELAPELDRLAGRETPGYGFLVMAGGRGATSRRLDPTRPLGDGKAWPRYRAGGWLETGPVAAETRLYGDTYFRDDPDGIDPGFDPRAQKGGRTDNAYLSVALPFGAVEIGRLARNWSALGTRGLMLSDGATALPSVGFELADHRVSFRAFTAELDTVLGHKRYLSGHQLSYNGHGRWYVSLGEAMLYASSGDAFSLRYLNPVEFLFFDAENPPTDLTPNLVLNAEAWVRAGSLTLHGEFLLDDYDLIPAPDTSQAPARYGLDLGVTWARRTAPLTLSVAYRQVSSFAYRASRNYDAYTYLQRGLGDNYADYDRLTLGLEYVPPVRGLVLSPALLIQRQGEGDIRVPFPADAYNDFILAPSLFLGVREVTYRAALRGRYQPSRLFWLAWDLGPNQVRNKSHVVGASTTEFQATGEIGVRLEFPRR